LKEFISIVYWNTKVALELLKATDLEGSLDMATGEDRETLEGATVDQIREKFKAQVASAEATKELHDAPYEGRFGYSRYKDCVHVDANVIEFAQTVHRN
jgi:hypothetical protein